MESLEYLKRYGHINFEHYLEKILLPANIQRDKFRVKINDNETGISLWIIDGYPNDPIEIIEDFIPIHTLDWAFEKTPEIDLGYFFENIDFK